MSLTLHLTEPKCLFPNAAHLELFQAQPEDGDTSIVPLNVQVSFGEQDFWDNDLKRIGCRLRFRRATLAVKPVGTNIFRLMRYERTLPEEKVAQVIERLTESTDSSKKSLFGGLSAKLSPLYAIFGIDAGLRAEVEKSIIEDLKKRLESKASIKIVRWVGSGCWEIGHEELGDPTELDGFLKGSYFTAPPDDRPEEPNSALCYLENSDDAGFAVDIELRCKLSDCVYIPLGAKLNEPNSKRQYRLEAEQEAMRLMLLKHNQNLGIQAPPGELVLAQGTLNARPIVEARRERNA